MQKALMMISGKMMIKILQLEEGNGLDILG